MAFKSRHCFAGTVTKYHGAGPFQNQIVPSNSMFIGAAEHMPNSGGANRQEAAALLELPDTLAQAVLFPVA